MAIQISRYNVSSNYFTGYFSQEFSSANTSINSKKLPIIYNKINWDTVRLIYGKNKAFIVGDYGAGRYTEHIRQFVESQGGYYFPYDPSFGNDNYKLKHLLEGEMVDILICSNVLNVIKEDNIVQLVHSWISNYDTNYFITIYEGDKSGVGRQTKKDCWQRNEVTQKYCFNGEIIKKGVICLESWSYLLK